MSSIFLRIFSSFLIRYGYCEWPKVKGAIKKRMVYTFFFDFYPLNKWLFGSNFKCFFIEEIGNRLLMSILAASASYIAVPAAMKLAAPKANPGLYIPMALAITFPFNIKIGMPLYLCIIEIC